MARQRRLLIVIFTGFAAACQAGPEADLDLEVHRVARDLHGLDVVESADARKVEALRLEVQRLRAAIDDVVAVWQRADSELQAAQARFQLARTRAREAGAAYETARAEYDAAAHHYRQVATLLIILAATSAVGESMCGSTTSTRAYRATLKARGIDLSGKDIDHVWPRALGGADHPLNYQVLDSHVNRGLGADVGTKLLKWPLATIQGLAVSAVTSFGC